MKTLIEIINQKKNREVISIAPDRPVFDALVIMAEYQIGALVVIEEGKMVGLLSERDYAREVILKGRSSKTTMIRDVMEDNVLTGSPDDLLEPVMSQMVAKHIRTIPVLEGEKLLGILSLGDLAKVMIDDQKALIEQLKNKQ